MTPAPLLDFIESNRLKDLGMLKAASADMDWVEKARQVAESLAKRDGSTDINAVYAVVGLPDRPNCAGSVFTPRSKWQCVGHMSSARVKRHAGTIRRWSLRC